MNTKPCTCFVAEALGSVRVDPLIGSDLCLLIQQFSLAISKTCFDDARLLIESFRTTRSPVSSNAEDHFCHLLLSSCLQIVKAESTYYSLNFMVPKAFFRRESTLSSVYSQIKGELCQMDNKIVNSEHSVAEDIRRRLIDFTSARVALINVYNSFQVENFGFACELIALLAVLMSVEDLVMPLSSHESFSSLFTSLSNEVTVIKLLLETQLALIQCNFLQSLIKLKSAHARISFWFKSIGYKRTEMKRATSFFPFGSQTQHCTLKLCDWIKEFYMLLLAKFSLYFHDSLQIYCSTVDFEHTINAVKSPNFNAGFSTFQRRMEPLMILLIADRTNAPDLPHQIGYHSSAESSDVEGELRKNFLTLLRIGGSANDVFKLLPSISNLVSEAAARKCGDRIVYCYDQLISKTFFVSLVEYHIYMTVIFNKRVSERDNMVVNFIQRSCNQLRCAKICQSLRKFCK
ncbi:unnamed protein product [Thelazia callipaeda]|uniref:WASH-7_N domain-containing protein n=1 Tax=Thelazia callipaeda TaxID=103827 RepID=A0A0N5CXJ3_THECL|nr:unnamed protein product [Thelazia callipaeda]